MTFQELRREVFEANHLDTEFFAERVTIEEPGKDPRPVVVKITEEQQALTDPMGNEDEFERIVVSCLRDPTNVTCGGIADPQIGSTQLVRESANDPDQRAYVYQGEQRARFYYKWKLVFARHRITAEGPRR